MHPIILHIETATKICSVAVSGGGSLLALVEEETDAYIHGESLTLFIVKALKEANVKETDLQAVSVSIGPGSYTGLRIGLSTAKGLCFGLDIPIICIPTLDSLLAIGHIKYPDNVICAMLDARRMEVYTKTINAQGSEVQELKAVVIEENTFLDEEPFVYFGDGAHKLQTLWVKRKAIFDSSLKISATGQIELATSLYKNETFDNLSSCKPLYLKQFGINT
jgi:tRNA threonylcarbamoyladenosine biosynthesis protein TsaB